MKRFFLIGLFVFAATPESFAEESFWQKVAWTTPDGVRMVGQFHRAAQAQAITWVLLHGLGSERSEWDAFARRLARQGQGIFIYDARGHGQSTKTIAGSALNYKDWTTAGAGSPWDSMAGDLEGALKTLRKRFQLSEKRLAVGGASLGANVALVYAGQHPKVPAVVLLSPGMNYAEVHTQGPIRTYPGPLFMAASSGDLYAYSSVRQLSEWCQEARCRVVEGSGAAHGVQMFQDEEFTKKLLDWMKKAGWK